MRVRRGKQDILLRHACFLADLRSDLIHTCPREKQQICGQIQDLRLHIRKVKCSDIKRIMCAGRNRGFRIPAQLDRRFRRDIPDGCACFHCASSFSFKYRLYCISQADRCVSSGR